MKKKCVVFCRTLSCFLLLLFCLLLCLLLLSSSSFSVALSVLLFVVLFFCFFSRFLKKKMFFRVSVSRGKTFFCSSSSSILQFFFNSSKFSFLLLRFVFVQIKNGIHYIVSQRAAVWRDHR